MIGVAGGTASGKTSVCNQIIRKLREDPVRFPLHYAIEPCALGAAALKLHMLQVRFSVK